jgi:NAD(P)-dependent dehydrogenase (short-subunit alcohol dehydrogenase family)
MIREFQSATPPEVFEAAMQPIDHMSTPEEQAGPLVLLSSNTASFVKGVVLPVDGGFMDGRK